MWLHDTRSGALLHRLRATALPIVRLTFSPDGRYLAGAGQRGVVDVWQVPSGELCRTLRVPDVEDSAWTAFSPDSQTLAIGVNGKVALWNVHTGHAVTHLPELGAGRSGWRSARTEGGWPLAGLVKPCCGKQTGTPYPR